MWLITPVGFFSVVQKSSDVGSNTLTVRARVRSDLEALRDKFLPGMGEIAESKSNDYRFRAVAPKAEVALAMATMVNDLDYSNFKNQVAKVQGAARAHLYHDVWDVLYRLQSEPKKYSAPSSSPQPPGKVFHPQLNNQGQAVELKKPSKPSPIDTWHQPEAVAAVVPGGEMPVEIHGVSSKSWNEAPETKQDWEALAAQNPMEEPAFKAPSGYKKAAGVVVQEKNGRVWVVAPSNEYAGYKATFPKGTVEAGMSLQATALVEAYEESGLQVRLLKHLVDVKRSLSYTRYYLAERVGGNPADMGWETQAVMLVPKAQLDKVVTHPNDASILEALSHV